MIKKIIKTVIYALGIVLSLCIISIGLKEASYKYPSPENTSEETVARTTTNNSTSEVDDYSFGADYYTDVYNALYNINHNLGVLQQASDANAEQILDAQQKNINQTASLANDVRNATVTIRQDNATYLGVIFIIAGAVVFLVYVEKLVNLYGFTIHHKKEKAAEQ